MVKLRLFLLVIWGPVFCFSQSDHSSQVKRKLNWTTVIEEYIPKTYFEFKENKYYLNNRVLNTSLSMLMWKCGGDRWLVVVEDWSSISYSKLKGITFMHEIIVFENGSVYETAFQKSYNYEVDCNKEKILIHFKYLYKEKENNVSLCFKKGEFITLN